MPYPSARFRRLALLTLGRTGLLRLRPGGRPGRPRGLWPGLDRRLGHALGGGRGGLGRHDLGGGRQRGDRPLVGPETRVLANGSAMVVARIHGRAPPLHGRRLPARERGPPAGQHARRVHRPAQGVRRRAQAGRVDPGRRLGPRALARRAAAAARVDRLGHARTIRCSLYRLDGHMALANSAALRAGRVTARHPRTSPAASSCAIRRTGEPTGVLKDEAMGPVCAAVPCPTDEQRDAALARALAYAASKHGVTAFAHVSVAPRRARRLPPGQGGRRPSPPVPRSTSRWQYLARRWPTRCAAHRPGRRLGAGSVA